MVRGVLLLKQINRVLLYFIGLFIIALGINMAILSNLGVSPVSAFTVPLSEAVEINLGTVTAACYAGFVLIEMIVLGKKFQPKNLLQIPFSIVFGIFINFIGTLLAHITLPNYGVRVIVMLLSIVICAVGAAIYITMDIVPNAPEGLILAFCERFGKEYGPLKILTDCIFVALGIIVSLVCLGGISDIREGTVISALITGKLTGIFLLHWKAPLQKIAFDQRAFQQQEELVR